MRKNIGEQIIKLKQAGVGYNEIARKLKCSRSLLSYHLGKGQKQKSYQRTIKRRSSLHPYGDKIETFIYAQYRKKTKIKPSSAWEVLVTQKILGYSMLLEDRRRRNKKEKVKTKMVFSIQDVIDKFGENPRCYLTGEVIDIRKPRTYQFDHIVPVSRGGDNSLNNLGICTSEANQAKRNMTDVEFIDFCEKVVRFNKNKK